MIRGEAMPGSAHAGDPTGQGADRSVMWRALKSQKPALTAGSRAWPGGKEAAALCRAPASGLLFGAEAVLGVRP